MRVLIILIATMTLSFLSIGQITVTNTNFVEVGDVIPGFQLDANLPGPGSSGPDQTWDFSNFDGVAVDDLEYFDPQSTPNFDDFPTSNLALLSFGTYFYEENDGTNWLLHGAVQSSFNPQDGVFKYTPPHFNAKFPMDYNDSYTHSYSKYFHQNGSGVIDSIVGIYKTHVSSVIDGWGTIITPYDSYTALREFRQEQDSVILLTYIGGVADSFSFEIVIDQYLWWSEDVAIKFPVAAHVVTDNTNGETLFSYYDIEKSINTSTKKEKNHSAIEIFPNPGNGIIQFNNSDLYTDLDVYNMLGMKIYSLNIKNKAGADLSGLQNGTYVLVFKSEDENISYYKKIVIEKDL